MARSSAGLLIFRRNRNGPLEVLLVHPGGPFWTGKDLGAWSIPKGEFEAGADPLAAARREFTEETGFETPDSPLVPLGSVRQRSGKIVHAWAVQGDFDPSRFRSESFSIEWPAGSGALREFPEVDRVEWFDAQDAKRKILPAQVAFIDTLELLEAARAAGHLGPVAPSKTEST